MAITRYKHFLEFYMAQINDSDMPDLIAFGITGSKMCWFSLGWKSMVTVISLRMLFGLLESETDFFKSFIGSLNN